MIEISMPESKNQLQKYCLPPVLIVHDAVFTDCAYGYIGVSFN